MDRGLWWATVHKVTKSDTTEATQPLLPAIWGQILFLDCLPSEFLVHRDGWQLWQMASSCIPPPQAPQQSVWGVRGGGRGGLVASAGLQAVCSILGDFIHIWRPEITDGCDISCSPYGRKYSVSPWFVLLKLDSSADESMLENPCYPQMVP